MKLDNNYFLGKTSNKFNIEYGTISLINYNKPVSEEWHYHENFHLSLILQGGNLESRKKGDIQVSTGKVLFYNEGELHCNKHTLFPSKNLNIELSNDFFKNNDIYLDCNKLSNKTPFSSYFKLINIYHELSINDLHTSNSICNILYTLFTYEEVKNKPNWLEKLIEIIEDRWNEFIPLQELASILNVHPVTISKYFRRYQHGTIGDFMRIVKLKRAFTFLLNSEDSITEIAYNCGFSDQSHMTKVFKAYVGFTPKGIRLIS
ncbi:helix-turn-helix domain-containing protein [Aquimarina algiphila]|nr:AraC family transcriptional regulator [Aquimarina algiphila]